MQSTKQLTEIDNNVASKRVQGLFRYISELNKLRQKKILNYKSHEWFLDIKDLPVWKDYVQFRYRDKVAEEALDEDDVILAVRKPEFSPCPKPGRAIEQWLVMGWDDFAKEPVHKDSIVRKNNKGEKKEEYFNDNIQRETEYRRWQKLREEWAQEQRKIKAVHDLFSDLYRLYHELIRDSEVKEIIVADGMFQIRNSDVLHPILSRRVQLKYDVETNCIYVCDTDSAPELYTDVLQGVEDINLDGISRLHDEMILNDYHPLDRNETPYFFKVFMNALASDSCYAEQKIPVDWDRHNRFLMYSNPCFIVRKRLDGTLKAIESIVCDIDDTGKIPPTFRDLVSGGIVEIPEDKEPATIEKRLAMVGGESEEILLSKEANKEQLEIAQRIEQYNAVLVQGPPGTGKTHTIANITGHFIAQGKNVLVTSHTVKALNVLKEKITPGLQSLCVSLLDDSNKDMESAVNGITEYMSANTSSSLKRELECLKEQRKKIIEELADVRKTLYNMMNAECNSIVYYGEEMSPSAAAKFVVENRAKLSYIPGEVKKNMPLPLSYGELIDLYQSNDLISQEDEDELEYDLPDMQDIFDVQQFSDLCDKLQHINEDIKSVEDAYGITIVADRARRSVSFNINNKKFAIYDPDKNAAEDLIQYSSSFGEVEKWQQIVAADGMAGGGYKDRWLKLLEYINEVNLHAANWASASLGKNVELPLDDNFEELREVYTELKEVLKNGKGLSFFQRLTKGKWVRALENVKINGVQPQNADDCALVLRYIKLLQARHICSSAWNQLMVPCGHRDFASLGLEPERAASNYADVIKKFVNWYHDEYRTYHSQMAELGMSEEIIAGIDKIDGEQRVIEKLLSAKDKVVACAKVLCKIIESWQIESELAEQKNIATAGQRGKSVILKKLVESIDARNIGSYSEAYAELAKVCNKYTLQAKRKNMLMRLSPVAPAFAEAIRKREGIHGKSVVPADIEDAWKWKQLSIIIDDMTKMSFREYQEKSMQLSKNYREITAEYAEKSGWYHLLRRTEADLTLKQALEGWRLDVKRIGKGTGKNAARYKASAREKMVKCQYAVPAWIMTINKALESLDPAKNKFDIVIIDEASQSDISSLAILYMGKKLIIVGDDQQVSPMAVGVDVNKTNELREMYLDKDMPNANNYDSRASIYDIAKTTFPSLMLKEHFRCVPGIIGFSNELSYDNRIVPLRASGDTDLLPAVVSYRVRDGERGLGKTNVKEADTIVALIGSCIRQPEYKGKTFGVISMLGDEQAQLIDKKINEQIAPRDREERQILCGNSANFQGDERDVVFLSMVDSNPTRYTENAGPLKLQGFGTDDSVRKRYNVAASRARDQLWVVSSLDAASDLKTGDIRKKLLEYAKDPNAFERQKDKIEKKADSPFEVAVALALTARGYHLVQQWKVGAYSLDMVAMYGDEKMAIECDGERWHSGEDKIRQDMERQAVLERIGWRFIRIRGSEFYRDQSGTIDRVVRELEANGIKPEENTDVAEHHGDTELLHRVKLEAERILSGVTEPQGKEGKAPKKASSTKTHEPLILVSEEMRNVANDTTPSLTAIKQKLKQNGYEVVDRIASGGLLWVIANLEEERHIKSIIGDRALCQYDRRGAMQTRNRAGFIIRGN